jgi:hypothetical protein
MLEVAQAPEPGQIVRVRQRQHLVEEVVPPPNAGEATLVRLFCVEDDAQGQALEVLSEAELPTCTRGCLALSRWEKQ